MESNEQTELTSKIEIKSWIESKMTARVGERLGRGNKRIEQKNPKTHGHRQQCGDCWWRAGVEVEEDMGGEWQWEKIQYK